MKKFRFRLERVMQYRKIVKDEKLRDLMEKNHRLYESNEQLRELQTALLLNGIEENMQMSAEQVQMVGLYSSRLSDAIVHQKLAILEAEQEVEEARAEYIEAAKDEESLETLKQNKLEEYKQYVAKEDEKFLDEVTVQKGNTYNKETDS